MVFLQPVKIQGHPKIFKKTRGAFPYLFSVISTKGFQNNHYQHFNRIGSTFHQNGSKPGSVHRLRFCDLPFPAKSKRKDLKSHDFRSFMVAAAGLEPAASGLWAALMLQSLAMHGFHAYFTPENRGKPEGQACLLLGSQADFHGNGSESGSELIGADQEMSRWNKEEDFSPLHYSRLYQAISEKCRIITSIEHQVKLLGSTVGVP